MAKGKMPDSTQSTPILAPTNKMKRRMFLVVLILLIAAAGYICTVIYNTMIVRSEYYRSKANSQQLSSYTINANRGTIYDRENKILAQSTTVWDVVLSPKAIAEDDKMREEKDLPPASDIICTTLSKLLDVDEAKLREACQNYESEYFIVKKKVDKDSYDKVRKFINENKLGVYSVNLMESSKRYYPNDSLASSIIGFTNYDNEGVYGLEAYYDDYLQGTDGLIVMAKDAKGNAMPYDYENRYEASDGNSLILTIDSTVQYYLEKNLESAVKQHKAANRATGIIMNSKTGAIIAMATAPGYDLNDPSVLSEIDEERLEEIHTDLIFDYAAGSLTDQAEIDRRIEEDLKTERAAMRELQWKNKAVSELYFPGSVFKVITCASALEEEVITLNSSFMCLGVYTVEDTDIHCWTTGGGHGTLVLQDALTKSCNPSFIQIGLKLGRRLFCNYFTAFGFTEKTGIDLPGEASPLFVPYERMGSVELASSSFGQTNKITPIQMICAYNAAINGGYLLKPYVVDRIIDSEGNVVKSTEPTIKRQVISGETSELMRQLTENVVTSNGGQNAYIAGYRIGGKSGTSQKLDEYHHDWDMRYVGSFCAFTPADDPEYIMLVCVNEPLGGKYYCSLVAGPVVSAVFSDCLENLGVHPQYTAEELEQQGTTVPYVYGSSLLDAITSINTKGLKYEIVGDQDNGIVDHTIPEAASPIPKNGTVVIYMTEAEELLVTVPDLTGCTVEQANKALANSGLNIALSGGGVNNPDAVATGQSVAPGTEVSKGTVISVTFLIDNSDEG